MKHSRHYYYYHCYNTPSYIKGDKDWQQACKPVPHIRSIKFWNQLINYVGQILTKKVHGQLATLSQNRSYRTLECIAVAGRTFSHELPAARHLRTSFLVATYKKNSFQAAAFNTKLPRQLPILLYKSLQCLPHANHTASLGNSKPNTC